MANGLGTNLKLLIVVGVLGGAAALKAFVFTGGHGDEETAHASEPLFKEYKRDEITAVLIEAPEGKKHELTKDGDKWKVASEGDAAADQTDVNKVLDAIGKLERGRTISSKGDNLARYGLEDAKATKVTAWGKGGRASAAIASFSIAKIPEDWRNVFLKLPGENAVRKVAGSTGDYEPGPDNTWRDKSIFDHGAAEQIAQVEITSPTGTIVLAREKIMGPKEKKDGEKPAESGAKPDPATPDPAKPDPAKPAEPAVAADNGAKPADGAAPAPEMEVKETVWNLLAPQTGRAKKWLCDSVANNVAKLECDSFFDGKETPAELGLEPPQYTIRVKREGESEPKTILLLGNKSKDGKYAAKLPDGAQIWWVASWKGDYLTKPVEELLETPPPKPGEPPKPEDAKKGDEAKKSDEPAKPDESKPAEGGGG